MTVGELAVLYLHWHKSHVSPNSHKHTRWFLERFVRLYGDEPADGCKPHLLDSWISENPKWGQWSRFHASTVLNACWNWAVRREYVGKNPFKQVKHRPGPRRRACTEAEFRAMLRVTGEISGPRRGAQFRRLLLFLRWSGLRPSELASLRWADVDLGAGVLVLREHKTSAKTRQPRVVPLVGPALRLLMWLRPRSHSPHVFVNSLGRPWRHNSIRLRFNRLRRRARVSRKVTPYTVRHLFATRAIERGVDVPSLSKILGHSDISMTQWYLHMSVGHLKEQMRRAIG